jgi:hypothetical protein
MLSPGQFHRLVPKDPAANTRYRKWLIEACRDNELLRVAVKAACKLDVLFWINSFVFQYNPDNIGHEVEQFITYDFQEHAILGHDDLDGTHLW